MESVHSHSTVVALVVAGGSGQRMGAPIAKQFIEIEGKPLLMHTLEKLANTDCFSQLVLVLASKDIEYWQSLCTKYQFTLAHKIVEGGISRFCSVQNGLYALHSLDSESIVAIHDGVRPFINKDFIQKGIATCIEYETAIPILKVNESLRICNESAQWQSLNREKVHSVQTPQYFKYAHILQAYQIALHSNFTDDASVYENTGKPLHFFDGILQNTKITQALDLEYAKFLFSKGY
ncbi:MAG: IspD/TarI family cytidylyltransferase [Bacteroidales bacterium]